MVTPEQVVGALRDVLAVRATVDLRAVGAVPHAVVTGPSGSQTWIDLAKQLAARGATADDVAREVLAAHGWSATDLDLLLQDLCGGLGICDPIWQKDRLVAAGPFTVDDFTDAVLRAEGLDPGTSTWRTDVRDVVAKHFGSSPV